MGINRSWYIKNRLSTIESVTWYRVHTHHSNHQLTNKTNTRKSGEIVQKKRNDTKDESKEITREERNSFDLNTLRDTNHSYSILCRPQYRTPNLSCPGLQYARRSMLLTVCSISTNHIQSNNPLSWNGTENLSKYKKASKRAGNKSEKEEEEKQQKSNW